MGITIGNLAEGTMDKERLRELRDRLGYSPTEMGAALGVSSRSVQNWESGIYPVPKPIQKLIKELWGNGKKS